MSSAFASRLAQLIGRPTPNKHDQGSTDDDSWYTPYTGTYEPPPPPPPSQVRPSITYYPPLDNTYSEQEQVPYSVAYPHPYSYQIPRFTEPDLDPNSALPAALPSALPLLSHSTSTETSRRGSGHTSKIGSGPSFLSGTGGIGESPVAPHTQVAKAERTSHRTSLASFMTFGGRRASHTPRTLHPPLSLTIPPHPASAQPVLSSFPDMRRPSLDQYHPNRLPRVSAPTSGYHTPPLTRKRTLTHSGFHTAPRSTSFRARAHSHVDESPQSFFDTSVLTKSDSLFPSSAPSAPIPATPIEHMGAFTHPFANAYQGPRHAPPVRPNPKLEPMRKTRQFATSPRERERERDREWDRKGKGKQRAIPDLGQGQILAIQAPVPSVRHAMKTSVSTPNLREEFHRTSAATSGGGEGREGRVGESVLAGQTLCDTFIFPRPRFQAHPITPPLTPERTWSSSQPSSGPPRPTVRPRANSLRWLRRKPSAPELQPPLPNRSDSRTEVERVIAEGERLNLLREQWREIAGRGLGSGRERERSKSRSRKSSVRSTAKGGSKEVGGREGLRVRARAKSLRGKVSVEFFKPRSNPYSHSNSNPQSQAHTSSGGTYTTTTGSGGTGGTHSRGPSSGGDVHHHQARRVDHGHVRSGSWGQTAIRRAQSICVGDLRDVSPGVEKVLDPATVPRHPREVSDARKALAMVSPEVRAAAAAIPVPVRSLSVPSSTEKGTGIGLAINVPPATQSFVSTSGAARYTGPQPSHRPTTNLVTRHRLPPRPSVQAAQPVSPASVLPEPPRESWMIYGAATEEDLMRSELQAVKEDAEARSVHQSPGQPQHEGIVTLTDAFHRRSVDSGLGSEEVHRSQNGGVEDMTFAAGGTLQRLLSSTSVSIGKQARASTKPDSIAATISSVRSGRPVSSAPSKSGFLIFEDEEAETEGETEGVFRVDSAEVKEVRPTVQDPIPALSPLVPTTSDTQSPASGSGLHSKPLSPHTLSSPAEPDPDKSPARTPASRASHRRIPSESKSERSWGRVYASENIGGLGSGVSSLESSPKMSPRPLGDVDDLEGYRDMFYRPSCLPKNNTPSNKSNTSLALLIPENNKSSSNTNSGGPGSGSGSGFGKRPELLTFDSARSGNSSASLSGRSLSAISAEVEVQHTRLEELEREHNKRWGSIMRSINGTFSSIALETFDPSEDVGDAEGARVYIEGDRPEGNEEGGDSYRIVTVQESLLPTTEFTLYRPRSTQLSVIEGSDDHLPSNIDSPSVESFDQQNNGQELEGDLRQSADVSTRTGDVDEDTTFSPTHSSFQRMTLGVPQQAVRDSLTAPSSVDPYQTRTSMATSGTDFSRISGLSDFPAPPLHENESRLTPGDILVRQSVFQPPSPGNGSASPSSTPLSPQTFDEDDPEVHERTRDSVLSGIDELDPPSMFPQASHRSTFGTDDEVIRNWKASRDSSNN